MGKRMLLLTQQFFFLGGPRPSTKARHAPNMAFTFIFVVLAVRRLPSD